MEAAHFSAALRALTTAEEELKSAGEPLAAMKVGAILRGLK